MVNVDCCVEVKINVAGKSVYADRNEKRGPGKWFKFRMSILLW
jgi:hypothetical protein